MKGVGYLRGVSFAFAFRLLSPTARERGSEPTIMPSIYGVLRKDISSQYAEGYTVPTIEPNPSTDA
jgi:hypothetical protein